MVICCCDCCVVEAASATAGVHDEFADDDGVVLGDRLVVA